MGTSLSAEEISRAVALYEEGLSCEAIGQGLRRTDVVIRRALVEEGVRLRTAKEQRELTRARRKGGAAAGRNCCYCNMILALVSTVHKEKGNLRSCDFCYHHVRHLRREPQGEDFWR